MLIEKASAKAKLINPMLGTVPRDPTAYDTYIENQKPEEIEEIEADTCPPSIIAVEDVKEPFNGKAKDGTGFHTDDTGLFIYDYMVKGFLKVAGNNLKDQLGIKALKAKVEEFVFVTPRRIYLGKKEPDGTLARSLRINDRNGARVTIARSDFVKEGTEIDFGIKVVKNPYFGIELVQELFEYGELKGLGQFRNGGYGAFEMLKFEIMG